MKYIYAIITASVQIAVGVRSRQFLLESQKTQKSARAQATNPQNLGMIQIYVLCYYYAAAVLSCDTSPREHACVNLISALMVAWAWLKSAIFSTM